MDLRRLEWAKSLSDETLTAIMNMAEWVEFHAGEVVMEVDSEVTHAYFLITGRMHVALYDLLGNEMQKDTFVRGSVVGLFPSVYRIAPTFTSRPPSLRPQYD